MAYGHVNFSRKFLTWEWHQDAHVVLLWDHILLLANYAQKEWHGITIERGQFVTSVRSLSELTHLTPKQIRTCLGKLKRTGEIAIKGTNKYSIITICKYDCYQYTNNDEGQTNGQADGQTNGQQHKKIRTNNIEDKSSMSSAGMTRVSTSSKPAVDIDYDALTKYWNETMRNSEIRPIINIKGKRMSMVHRRAVDYGKASIMTVIEKAAVSKKLNGDNWKHKVYKFDDIMSPQMFLDILEGNYDN